MYKGSLLLTKDIGRGIRVDLNVYYSVFSHIRETEAGDFFLSYLPSKFMCIPMNFFRIKIIFLFEILDLCPCLSSF